MHFKINLPSAPLKTTTAEREVHEELRFQLLWGRRGRKRRMNRLEAFGKGMELDGSAPQLRERWLAGAELEESRDSHIQATLCFAEHTSQSSLSFPTPLPLNLSKFLPWQKVMPRFSKSVLPWLHCLKPRSSSSSRAPTRALHRRKIPAACDYFNLSTYIPVPKTYTRYLSSTNMEYFKSCLYFPPCFYTRGSTAKRTKRRLTCRSISCHSSPCCIICHNIDSSR